MSIYKKISKKVIAISTAAMIMAGVSISSVSAAPMPFRDVSGQYVTPVEYLYINDIVNGTSSTTFGTNNSIKRGDTAVIIAGALSLDLNSAPDAGFTDLGRYAPAVNALYKEGIISGINETEFKPSVTLSRGAMAKILVEAYDIPAATKASPFTDAIGAFGKYIDALYEANITGGKTPTSFGKDALITRGEFAVLLYKTIIKYGAGTPINECKYDPQSTVNPDLQTINCIINEVVKESGYTIPPEIVKAVAEEESGWTQFKNGVPLVSGDGGIGIMQITRTEGYEVDKLKYDLKYNIRAGINFLVDNFTKRTDLPRINNHDPQKLESWYFAVMAYNGIVPSNSPVKKDTGERNLAAYQEKVYNHLEGGNLITTHVDSLVMKPEDFEYDQNSGAPIKFITKSYTLNESMMTPTNQLFNNGDVVTYSGKGLRSIPSTGGSLTEIAPNTKLKIISKPLGDQTSSAANHYVWYQVQVVETGKKGYIASPYIIR